MKTYDQIQLLQYESGNKIYMSNVVYFDITYKLIEIYNTFLRINTTKNYEKRVDELMKYVEKELNFILSKLSVVNRVVYLFIDYRFINGLTPRNIIFKDFLNYEMEDGEKVNSIPMIKRKYINEGVNEENVEYLKSKVRCMFELKSIYSVSNEVDIEKYISIPYLIKKNEDNEFLKILNNEGKFRYLILRGAKYVTRKRRGKCLFSFLDKDCENLDKQLLKSIESGNEAKITECMNYIPFTLIIYAFPKIIEKLKFSNVKFLGCEIESDFAISKHIHTYSKNAFPTVYSSDTDMLVHMCDVNCVIKLTMKITETKRITYFINPSVFWKEIFGCELSKKLIKTICVLMGTDYNPYNSSSPIHIKRFEDVLKMMNVESFDKLDEDLLFAKIYMIMKVNEGNIYCKQTAIALNMYLNDLEGDIHFITSESNKKINISRFLKYSRRSIFQ